MDKKSTMDCETNKKNASPSEYQNAKSHHKESVSSIEKGHSIELAHAIKQLHDKFALTLAKKGYRVQAEPGCP
jgi:hypothetical protein